MHSLQARNSAYNFRLNCPKAAGLFQFHTRQKIPTKNIEKLPSLKGCSLRSATIKCYVTHQQEETPTPADPVAPDMPSVFLPSVLPSFFLVSASVAAATVTARPRFLGVQFVHSSSRPTHIDQDGRQREVAIKRWGRNGRERRGGTAGLKYRKARWVSSQSG
jgi:hypothetical protein